MYHISTVFYPDTTDTDTDANIIISQLEQENEKIPESFEVDRRFSQFEKLLEYLRKALPSEVIPELPKKRYFNKSDQVIELRR